MRVRALDVARLGGEIERDQERQPAQGVCKDIERRVARVTAVKRGLGVVWKGLPLELRRPDRRG